MAPMSLFAALALALAASAPAGVPVLPTTRLAAFVVVRTRDGMQAGRRLRFDDGQFLVEEGGRIAKVADADVVHIAFVPSLDGPPLSMAVGLALRLAAPARARRLFTRRGDLLEALLRSGGIFFVGPDEVVSGFPRFVRQVADAELTGVLCHEMVWLSRQRKQEREALRLLGEAAKELHGSDRGFVCALMRTALLYATSDPRAKDEMGKLFETYRERGNELLRFRAVVLGGFPRGRRGRPNGGPEPSHERPHGLPSRPDLTPSP